MFEGVYALTCPTHTTAGGNKVFVNLFVTIFRAAREK
jgi:hypothetical protein